MASLELLLHKGPPNGNGNGSGDLAGGLEQLRYTVLSDGIPSNSDGMVRLLVVPCRSQSVALTRKRCSLNCACMFGSSC